MTLEARILAAHAARPGFTARGFARSGSYDRLAASVPVGARVLDLACGDGALLDRIPGSIGIDLSRAELALARERFDEAGLRRDTTRGRLVCGRTQALPFAGESFEVVTCHLAFMLFDPLDAVVAELDRVLVPGGSFLAMMGGGPVANPAPDDAFPIFLDELAGGRALGGDARARSEAGWRGLFVGWELPPWERCELVLDGDFDQVWSFFAASYELPDDPEPLRVACARRLPSSGIRCRAVTWLARATKP